jgi:hypothetical protein
MQLQNKYTRNIFLISLSVLSKLIIQEAKDNLKVGTYFALDTTLDKPAFIVPSQKEKSIELSISHDPEIVDVKIELYINSEQNPSDQIPIEIVYGSIYDYMTISIMEVYGSYVDAELFAILSQLIQIYKENPDIEEFTIK